MGLPRGQKAKDNVILRSYAGSTKTQAILDWVNYNLASRIRYLVSLTYVFYKEETILATIFVI